MTQLAPAPAPANAQAIRDFARDGVIRQPAWLDAAAVAAVLQRLQLYLQTHLASLPASDRVFEADGQSVRNLWRMEHYDQWFGEWGHEPRLWQLVSDLLGDTPQLVAVETFNKPARVGSAVPPHQDNAYFCLTPPLALTVWVALDPVTPENGPVHYLAGSHQQGVLPHVASGVAGNSMGLRDPVPRERCQPWLLAAGDLLVHHCQTIHFSEPNTSPWPRRSLLLVYRGASASTDAALRARYDAARQARA